MSPPPETPRHDPSADGEVEREPESSDGAENQAPEASLNPRPPRRWLRFLGVSFLLLLLAPLLVAGALLIYPFRLSLDRWTETFDRELTQLIGRDITIEGSLALVTGTRPSIEVTDLSIDNPPGWESSAPLARLAKFRTTIGLSELFQREIAIDDILIQGLVLNLERAAEGAGNWEGIAPSFTRAGEEADSDDKTPDPAESRDVFDLSSTGFEHVIVENIEVLVRHLSLGASAPNRPLLLNRLEGTALAGEPIDFRVRGEFLGLPFDAECEGGTLATLVSRENPWPATISGHLGQSRFEISGHRYERGFETPGVVHFDLEIPEVEELFPLTGDLPDIGSLKLVGIAERRGPDLFFLPALEGKLGESPLEGSANLDLSGEVPHIDGTLSVDFISLALFQETEAMIDPEELVETEPGPAPSNTRRAQRRAVTSHRTEATSQPFHGTLRLQIGDVHGIESPATVRDLDLVAEVSEEIVTAQLTAIFAEMELEGRLDIKANTQENVRFALALDGGEADLTDLAAHYLGHEKFKGRLDSVSYRIEGQGTRLAEAWEDRSVLLEVENADVSYPLFGEQYRFFVEEGSIVHHTGPDAVVNLAGDFRNEPFDVQLDLVKTEVSTGTEVRVSRAVGRFADIELELMNELLSEPFSKETVRIAFEVSGQRLDKLDHLYELNLPPVGPYSASGIYRHAPDLIGLDDFQLTVGNSHLEGDCLFEDRDGRLFVTLDLSSPTIQLNDFSTPDWSPVAGNPSRTETNPIVDLLSHDVLDRFDADIKLNVGNVMSGKDRLGRGSATAELRSARLSLSPLVLGIPGGEFQGKGLFHPKSDGSLDWRFELAAENFDVGVIARREDPDSVFRGPANLDIAVGASGVPYGKPHLRAATGTLDIDFCPENLDSGSIDVWVQNLIILLLPRLDPDNRSTVNCIIGRLKLEDGLITTETLGMDTTTMRVAAEGQIDLARETIQLKLDPVPKRPQLFSLQVPVAIEGSLTEPEFVMGRRPALRALAHLTKNTLLFPASFFTSRRLPEDGSDICRCRHSE